MLACSGVTGVVIVLVHRRGVAASKLFDHRHPDEFSKLGRPRASFANLIANSRFDRFILSRQYRRFADPEFSAACDRLRRYDFAVLVCILLTLGYAWWPSYL